MGVHKWEDVKRLRLTPEKIEEVRAKALREVVKMTLPDVRKAVGKTQVELSRETGLTQSELSRLERRADMKISTLRRYIKGLGGEMMVTIKVKGRTYRLPFPEDDPAPARPTRKTSRSDRRAAH